MQHKFHPHERDLRPQFGAWAPGTYICLCVTCKNQFFGDKRAHECADCAYDLTPKPQQPVHHICAWMIHQFSKRWASTPGQQ